MVKKGRLENIGKCARLRTITENEGGGSVTIICIMEQLTQCNNSARRGIAN